MVVWKNYRSLSVDDQASLLEQTNALRGLAWIILPQESRGFFQTTVFYKVFYVIVIVSEKDRSIEGGDSSWNSNS
ncbi:hypothetical protein CR203_05580 [Salipaludibacillus neizhouensis]|uniref:Uncharacterized protein n=1 Tax=Salipaludibacillus neizhouensis TaxID=885475 RepID=A0A3A9KTN0_9BACI|nr:hypothetical protein [Salipaludibacillus neizhouensis]RKL67976.1 hypothetical protein CR203_05580 [Salipaludibacillus neizhouensis]